MQKNIFIILFLVIPMALFSQVPESDISDIIDETKDIDFSEAKTIYKNELYGGLLVHSFGWGANFRKGKHITAKWHRIYSFEAVGMKHPKEYKTYNPHRDNNRGFVYGKLNTLTVFRPSFGIQKIMFTKEGKKAVEISSILFCGASLGFVKPVYLQILPPANSSVNYVEEKYDPEKHTLDKILGRADVFKGVGEGKFIPGIHGKFAINFEYSPQENIIRALETGVAFDAFTKQIPMMAFIPNKEYYLTYFISWHFGKKSY